VETIGNSHVIRFSSFEADLRTRELRKHGLKLKLQDQPFQVLAMLLERPGELVTREEIRARLWPQDTFVDFDHGLNAAVRRLREALNDNAEAPRFVETLPRRGYRFITPVEPKDNGRSIRLEAQPANSPVPGGVIQIAARAVEADGLDTDSAPKIDSKFPKKLVHGPFAGLKWLIVGAVAAILIIVGLTVWERFRHPDTTGQLVQRQLTANPSEIPLQAAAISPDGKYLAYSDSHGLHLQIIKDGQTKLLSKPEQLVISDLSWLPDGTGILASGESGGDVAGIWLIPILGGSPIRLREEAAAPVASPHGTDIAFLSDFDAAGAHGIWLMDITGENAHRVLASRPREQFFRVRWSPDGERIAFTRSILGVPALRVSQTAWGIEALETVSLNHGSTTAIVTKLGLQDFYWLSDGRILFSVAQEDLFGSDSNLWAIHINRTGKSDTQPEQLTTWAGFSFTDFSATKDGRSLAFLKLMSQMDVYVGKLNPSRTRLNAPWRLTLNDRNDWPIEWTSDGAVLFWSDRNGTWNIFKQRLDQQTAEMIPTGPEPKWYAHFSPDRAWLLYMALPKQQQPGGSLPVKIMRVPAEGGAPEQVLSAVGTTDFSCARLPATLCVFNEVIGSDSVITSFDPIRGRGREVFREKSSEAGGIGGFSLSPEGTRLAITRFDPREGRIRLVSLKDGSSHDVVVEHWNSFFELNWAPDGRGLYVSSQAPEGGTVLDIDLQGHARALWHQKRNIATCGRPSPDGRSLAVATSDTNANAWMLENP
jgi:Tol biopolymer transport system component/DNA-binding winged helix-turn-helix (wHTH) protein